MDYDMLGRPRYGSSLFKFLVISFIVAICGGLLVLIFGGTASNVTGRTRSIAQGEAREFLRIAGIDGVAQCVSVDSDGDGYVSCSYTTKDGVIHPLECAGSMNINKGCRPPKAVFQPVQSTQGR